MNSLLVILHLTINFQSSFKNNNKTHEGDKFKSQKQNFALNFAISFLVVFYLFIFWHDDFPLLTKELCTRTRLTYSRIIDYFRNVQHACASLQVKNMMILYVIYIIYNLNKEHENKMDIHSSCYNAQIPMNISKFDQ